MDAEWTTAGQPPRQAGECVELSAACLCLLSSTAVIANKQRRNQQTTDEVSVPPDWRPNGQKSLQTTPERRTMRAAWHFLHPQKKRGGGGVINSAGGFHATPRSRVLSSVNTKSAVVSALVLNASGLSRVPGSVSSLQSESNWKTPSLTACLCAFSKSKRRRFCSRTLGEWFRFPY